MIRPVFIGRFLSTHKDWEMTYEEFASAICAVSLPKTSGKT